MDNIQKQLIAKLGEEFANIFPLQYVSNILDGATGETLTILLSRYNHIFIPFTGEKEVTRAAVPPIMRRKGLYITYITPNSEIITEYFKGNKTEVNNEDWVKDKYWGTNLTSDNFVPITLPDGSITADKLSQEVLDLIGQGFKGNIENHPDGEDLTSTELATVGNTKYKVLRFADRNYTQDGMGYVILRKNKTFAEQVTKSNTIYEIRYNFDLDGKTVNIPDNCVLKFEGGSVSNGTISLVNTYIEASSVVFKNVVLNGSIRNKCFEVLWAGAIPDNNLIDTGQVLYNIESLNTVLLFKTGKYYIDEYFTIKEGLNIQGDSDNINNNTIFYPFRNGQNYIIKLGGNKDTYNDNVNRCRRPIIKGITFATNGEFFTNNSATDYEFGLLVLNRVEIGNFAIAFRNLSNVIPLWIGFSYELTFDYISCYVNKVPSNIPVIYFGAVGLKDVSALNINSLACETITGPIISQRAGSSVSELYISEVNFESSVNFLGEGIHLINNDPDYYYHIRQVNSEDYEDFNSTIKIPLFNINTMYGYIGNITCNRIGMSKWINDLDGDGEYRTYGFISIKNNNIATPLVINNVTLLSSAYCYLEDLSANNYSGELTINNINFPIGRYVNSVLQPSSGYIICNVNDKGVSNIKVVNHNCMTNYPKVIKELTIDSQNYNNLCFSSRINTTEGNLIKTFSKEKISRTYNLDINIFKSTNKDLIFYSPTVDLILSDYILIRDLSVLEIDGFINVNDNIIFYIDYYEYTYTEGIRNLVPTLVSTDAFNVAFTNSSLTRLTKLIKANSIIKVRRQTGYNFYVNNIRITEANKVFKGKINPISGSEGIIFYTEDGDLKIIEKNYKTYKIPIVSDKEIILYSAEQTLLSDKIYKVISDIGLSGRTLTLPANCTLDFQGGSFSNGTIVGNNTTIVNTSNSYIFKENLNTTGGFILEELDIRWFGAKPDFNGTTGTDCSPAIQKALDWSQYFYGIYLGIHGKFYLETPIVTNMDLNMRGDRVPGKILFTEAAGNPNQSITSTIYVKGGITAFTLNGFGDTAKLIKFNLENIRFTAPWGISNDNSEWTGANTILISSPTIGGPSRPGSIIGCTISNFYRVLELDSSAIDNETQFYNLDIRRNSIDKCGTIFYFKTYSGRKGSGLITIENNILEQSVSVFDMSNIFGYIKICANLLEGSGTSNITLANPGNLDLIGNYWEAMHGDFNITGTGLSSVVRIIQNSGGYIQATPSSTYRINLKELTLLDYDLYNMGDVVLKGVIHKTSPRVRLLDLPVTAFSQCCVNIPIQSIVYRQPSDAISTYQLITTANITDGLIHQPNVKSAFIPTASYQSLGFIKGKLNDLIYISFYKNAGNMSFQIYTDNGIGAGTEIGTAYESGYYFIVTKINQNVGSTDANIFVVPYNKTSNPIQISNVDIINLMSVDRQNYVIGEIAPTIIT